MKTRTKWAVIQSSVALFLVCELQAGTPIGDYSTTLSGDLGVWDFSGSYSESVEGIAVDYTTMVDPTGKITGSGDFDVDLGSIGASGFLNGDVKLTGKSSGNSSLMKVILKLGMTGSGLIQGYTVFFTANVTEKLEFDQNNNKLQGTISGSVKVNVPGEGSASQRIPTMAYSVDVSPTADGEWTIDLVDLEATGSKSNIIVGTAMVTLANEFGSRELPLSAKGKYSSKTDLTKLSLLAPPDSESVGAKLKLVIQAISQQELSLESVSTKLLGQKVVFKKSAEQAPSQPGGLTDQTLTPAGAVVVSVPH